MQLVVLSGKGGTGKTTVASALIHLFGCQSFADCDVDAPNLHLVTSFEEAPKGSDFQGMPKSQIDAAKCTGCGLCMDHCRFNAIASIGSIDGEVLYSVKPFSCEGCGVCEAICPSGAAELWPHIAGEMQCFKASSGKEFSTAKLKMGSGTSGKLVTAVKKQLNAGVSPLQIVDGSPGIGCPVIASISGATHVLVVTEPSLSGLSDMERIVKTSKIFNVPVCVAINKWDVDRVMTTAIEAYCQGQQLAVVGKIPYDTCAAEAINHGVSIMQYDCTASSALRELYADLGQWLLENDDFRL